MGPYAWLSGRTGGRIVQSEFMRFQRLAAAFALVFAASVLLPGREPVRARKAMVVAQEPLATDVGVAVLKAGGNAVDAAVAVAFALAVTHPFGGQPRRRRFSAAPLGRRQHDVHRLPRSAPEAARSRHVSGRRRASRPRTASSAGARPACPAPCAGSNCAHKKYGRKPWAELVQPAVELAANGFRALLPAGELDLRERRSCWTGFPNRSASFLKAQRLLRAGRHAGAAGTGRDAGAHRARRGQRFLRRRDGAATGRGDEGQRRPDHARGL